MTNTHTHTYRHQVLGPAAAACTPSPSVFGRFSPLGAAGNNEKQSVNHMTYWRLLQQIGVTIWRHYKRRKLGETRIRRNTHTRTHTLETNWTETQTRHDKQGRYIRGDILWNSVGISRRVAAVASFNAPTSPLLLFLFLLTFFFFIFFFATAVANLVWHYCSCKPAKSRCDNARGALEELSECQT